MGVGFVGVVDVGDFGGIDYFYGVVCYFRYLAYDG